VGVWCPFGLVPLSCTFASPSTCALFGYFFQDGLFAAGKVNYQVTRSHFSPHPPTGEVIAAGTIVLSLIGLWIIDAVAMHLRRSILDTRTATGGGGGAKRSDQKRFISFPYPDENPRQREVVQSLSKVSIQA
jgi:hypothetical protein